jgi:hypothetical protein
VHGLPRFPFRPVHLPRAETFSRARNQNAERLLQRVLKLADASQQRLPTTHPRRLAVLVAAVLFLRRGYDQVFIGEQVGGVDAELRGHVETQSCVQNLPLLRHPLSDVRGGRVLVQVELFSFGCHQVGAVLEDALHVELEEAQPAHGRQRRVLGLILC